MHQATLLSSVCYIEGSKNGCTCFDEPNGMFVPGLVRLAAVSQCYLESSALLRRLQSWVSDFCVITKCDVPLRP